MNFYYQYFRHDNPPQTFNKLELPSMKDEMLVIYFDQLTIISSLERVWTFIGTKLKFG